MSSRNGARRAQPVRWIWLVLERLQAAEHASARRLIANSALLSGLSRQQIIQLGTSAQRHIYRAGDKVFAQGDPADCAFFLVRGRMNVQIDIPGMSRKKRVSTLTDGTIFGEMGLIDGAPRSASVTASRDCICYSIDADNYTKLQAHRPDLVVKLLNNVSRQFSTRLRVANTMIAELDQ